MPNVGRPSRDCHLCRQRRVKCDLGRPGCQRCVKYGTECPGYRNEQELVFRSVNPTGAKKRRKPGKPAGDEDSSPDQRQVAGPLTGFKQQQQQQQQQQQPVYYSSSSSSDESTSTDTTIIIATSPETAALTRPSDINRWQAQDASFTISPALVQHWTNHSVPIALAVYGHIDFFHTVVSENPQDGPLIWATHLFSRTYVTNMRQPTALSRESEAETTQELAVFMGKTLSAVNAALSSPKGFERDDILGTIWMLANYEIIVGSVGRMEHSSPWHHHATGLWALLKARGKESLTTPRGRDTFWPAWMLVQLEAMTSNKRCPPESADWLDTLQPYSVGQVGYHLALYMVEVCEVQARCIEIIFNKDYAQGALEFTTLLNTIIRVETRLGLYKKTRMRELNQHESFVVVMYLACVVKVFNVLHLLANLLTHDPYETLSLRILYMHRNYCVGRVRAASSLILTVTPQAVEELMRLKYNVFAALFQALRLVWPLTCVRLMNATLPSQKTFSGRYLQIIGRELGVRQAAKKYKPSEMIPLEARDPRPLPGHGLAVEPEDPYVEAFLRGEIQETEPGEFLIGQTATTLAALQTETAVVV